MPTSPSISPIRAKGRHISRPATKERAISKQFPGCSPTERFGPAQIHDPVWARRPSERQPPRSGRARAAWGNKVLCNYKRRSQAA